MRTPWQVRAWATGASLALNGALVLGVMVMNPGARMAVMEETAMLVSLGDPSLTDTDNAIRTSEEELQLAVSEFGVAETEPFTRALEAAKKGVAAS